MRTILLLAMSWGLTACTASTHSSNSKDIVYTFERLEITWQAPHLYSDVKAANQPDKHFRERTFERLSSFIAELSDVLPDGHKLKMTVTDLDLAGRRTGMDFQGEDLQREEVGSSPDRPDYGTLINLQYRGSPNEQRMLSRLYPPRIAFNYQVLDAASAVVKQGSETLENGDYLLGIKRHQRRNLPKLGVERYMLGSWFADTFVQDQF